MTASDDPSEILGHVMRRRPVMCAIEEGEASRHAIRAAAWLARALQTELVLAHAFDPMGIPARPRAEMLARDITDDDLADVARRAAGLLLDDAAGSVTGVDVATAEIDPRFEGRGLGSQLIAEALDDACRRRLAVPFCPFVRSFIASHADYVDLVPDDRRVAFGLADGS